MADETLPTYAKAGGPPDDWTEMQVFNVETGLLVPDVYEVNTVEGWVEVYPRDERGRSVLSSDGRMAMTERIPGNFRLQRRPVG